MLEINSIFNEKYVVEKIIGQGGMGRVYKVKHIELGVCWAVKEMTYTEKQGLDLLAEPNILKKLNHPSLPKIIDIIKQNNTIYIMMDYIEGLSLKEALKERKKFSEKEVIDFAKQLCKSFIYLHSLKPKPIIYRDMKPDNVMLTKDGRLIVIDFGLAREFKEGSQNDTVLGYTKGYAAPEQQSKEGQSDRRTDIYSLGVTLYHLVTGKSPYEPPYDFTKAREVDATLSEGIEYIIRKCVQNNPDDRYQTVEELLYDFNNIFKLNSAYKKNLRAYIIKKSVAVIGIIASLLLIYNGVDTMAEERSDKFQGLIDKGIEQRNNNQSSVAIKNFNKAIEVYKERTEPYKEIAETYLDSLDNKKTVEYIQNIAFEQNKECKKDDAINYILGTAYYNEKDYLNAEFYLGKAINISPLDIRYKRDYAVALGRNGKVEEAQKVIDELKSKNSQGDIIEYLQGEINSINKKYAEAITNFENSINASKDEELQIKAYKSIVKIYCDNPEVFPDGVLKAVEVLEKGRSSLANVDDAEYIELEGDAYNKKADYVRDDKSQYEENLNKSANKFITLIDMGYKQAYLYNNVGNIYNKLKNYEKSENYLLEAKKLDEHSPRIYRDLAILYANIENDKEEANRDYSKFIDNYNLAVKYSKDGEKNIDIINLVNFMSELKENGLVK